MIKFFLQELKLKYYELMIKLDQHDSAYLSIVKHYRAILDTPVVKDDNALRNEVCKML